MTQEPVSERPGERLLGHVEYGNRVYEAISGAISALSALNAFITGLGGLVAFFVQVGIMGFALYISLFVAVPVALGVNRLLEGVTRRESTDKGFLAILIGLLVVIALVIRFVVFYDGIGSPGDLDAVGTLFSASVGVAILAVPFIVLWWRKGSIARSTAM